MEGQLRDTQWKLQQLQTQYDYLVSKSTTHNESSRHSEAQLEDAQLKLRELRRALEELRLEKEVSDAKVARIGSLEELVAELRQANRSLEDKIARLCDSPFISDAFGLHETRLRYEELLKEREDLKMQIGHMKEALTVKHSALTTVQKEAARLLDEKDAADKKVHELMLQLGQFESGNSALNDKLKMYTGSDGVDIESLERALTMVKRRDAAMERLPFLEDPENEKLITLPTLKRKLSDLQQLNLRLTQDNARLENLLKMQSNLNRDLHKEIEASVRSKDKDKLELEKKAEDFEQIALQRLDKIHSLEAQLRQFVYGLSKTSKNKPISIVSPEKEDGIYSASEIYDASDLIAELLGDRDGDLRPDENLMEVWVKEANIKDGVLPPASSTFVVVDFFDYESQATTLLTGMKPQWDFAATYKLSVDDFMLRYFATGAITIELNMVSL